MTTTPAKIAHAAALTGGVAWLVDTLVITINDGAFGASDTVLYLIGLLSLVVAAATAGYAWRGVPGALGVFLAVAVLATAIEAGVQGIVHALYDGSNQGLNDEIGLMACGAVAVALAVATTRRRA